MANKLNFRRASTSTGYKNLKHAESSSTDPPHDPQCPSKVCRMLCIACCTLFVILFVLGVILLIIYLALNPRPVTYHINTISIPTMLLTITNSSSALGAYSYNSAFDMELLFDVQVYNPNTKLRVDFERLRIDIFYHDTHLGSSYLAPFYQDVRSNTSMKAQVLTRSSLQKFLSDSLSSDIDGNVVPISAEVSARVKVKAMKMTIPLLKMHATCYLQFSPPTSPGGAKLLSKRCKPSKPTCKF